MYMTRSDRRGSLHAYQTAAGGCGQRTNFLIVGCIGVFSHCFPNEVNYLPKGSFDPKIATDDILKQVLMSTAAGKFVFNTVFERSYNSFTKANKTVGTKRVGNVPKLMKKITNSIQENWEQKIYNRLG